MATPRSDNNHKDDVEADDFNASSSLTMDSAIDNNSEIQLVKDTVIVKKSPRSGTGASSSEVFSSSGGSSKNQQHAKRSQSARSSTTKTPIINLNNTNKPLPVITSSIPIKISESPIINKVPALLKNVKSTSRTSSISVRSNNIVASKHTLELQFISKNKRYVLLKNELLEKQKPVLELYQALMGIKKRLDQLGKTVNLEEIKFLTYNERRKALFDGSGEKLPDEVLNEMRRSIEEIPHNLMEVCKNLLSRRALIVDLLEGVTKHEVDISEVSNRIDSLKSEGHQLQQSLDAIIDANQDKIKELVGKWQNLLSAKFTAGKTSELQAKADDQDRLIHESNNVIYDLKRKLDEKRLNYDKSVGELNGIITTLREHIRKLETDLESERKQSIDVKTRSITNSQNVKSMRNKIAELENEKKNFETSTSELQRKLTIAEEQLRLKDTQWTKEKNKLIKKVERQDSLLNKFNTDKTDFEQTLEAFEEQKMSTEEELKNNIVLLSQELNTTKQELQEVTQERNTVMEKCAAFEGYIVRMGKECQDNMDKISSSIEWGKNQRNPSAPEAENYIEDIAKDLKIRELEDKVRKLETERIWHIEERNQLKEKQQNEPSETEKQLTKQQECISKYQMLLENSESKLREKSAEITILQSEIRQLKVRQEALEDQNHECPIDELQRMAEKSRYKLNDLMKKSIESEQKLEYYAEVIEKQTQQMSDMENLLRYRENMAGVLKASRDELIGEKESLSRYAHEMRSVLREVVKEGKMKDRLIKEIQEKIDLRERQISKLEKEVKELETNLVMTNEKRFKLQERVGTMEKELQTTKAHVNQLADINQRNIANERNRSTTWRSRSFTTIRY